MEEEAPEASLMKRRNHGSKPSSSPNTACWLPLSELEALAYDLVLISLQISEHCPYENDSCLTGSPQILHTPSRLNLSFSQLSNQFEPVVALS